MIHAKVKQPEDDEDDRPLLERPCACGNPACRLPPGRCCLCGSPCLADSYDFEVCEPCLNNYVHPAYKAEINTYLESCGGGCPGWAPFNEGDWSDGSAEIQRCDTCKRFDDDDGARSHVLAITKAARDEAGQGGHPPGDLLPEEDPR